MTTKRKETEEYQRARLETIKKLALEGKTKVEIASHINYSISLIEKIMREYKIKVKDSRIIDYTDKQFNNWKVLKVTKRDKGDNEVLCLVCNNVYKRTLSPIISGKSLCCGKCKMKNTPKIRDTKLTLEYFIQHGLTEKQELFNRVQKLITVNFLSLKEIASILNVSLYIVRKIVRINNLRKPKVYTNYENHIINDWKIIKYDSLRSKNNQVQCILCEDIYTRDVISIIKGTSKRCRKCSNKLIKGNSYAKSKCDSIPSTISECNQEGV